MPTPSCDQCHRRRLHCIGEKPRCRNCGVKGQTCTYSTGKPVGKPKGHRKVRKTTLTDQQDKSQTESKPFQATVNSISCHSSPSSSEFSDMSESWLSRNVSTTATGLAALPDWATKKISNTIPAEYNPSMSGFTSPYNVSPERDIKCIQNTGNAEAQMQQAQLKPSYFSTDLVNGLKPAHAMMSPDQTYFGWQPVPDHRLTMSQQPFFGPPTSLMGTSTFKESLDPPLQSPPAFGGDCMSGALPQNGIVPHRCQQPLWSSCNCPQLSETITRLFKSHLDPRSDFDTLLTSVHNGVEEFRKSLSCSQCSVGLCEPTMFIMLLQQAFICCQRLSSLAANDSTIPRPELYQEASHRDEFSSAVEREMRDMQRTVRISVVHVEVTRLRQLVETVKFFSDRTVSNGTEQSSVATLLFILDEGLALLQRPTAFSEQ